MPLNKETKPNQTLNEPKLIHLHTVKLFQVLLFNTNSFIAYS